MLNIIKKNTVWYLVLKKKKNSMQEQGGDGLSLQHFI